MTNSSPLPNNSKDNNKNATIPPKPYSQYTIFFRLERKYILHSSGVSDDGEMSSLDPNHFDPVEFPRPDKYAVLTLPPYWYSSSLSAAAAKKRRHRKRKGRIGLEALSKTISAAWRSADQTVIQYCRKLAQSELEKYTNLIGQESKAQVDATGNTKPLKQSDVFEDAVSIQEFTHTQASASIPRLHTNELWNNIASEVTCAGEIDQEDQILLNELNIQALRQQLEVNEHKINELCMDLLQPNTMSPVQIAKDEGKGLDKKRRFNHQVTATSMPRVKTVDGYIGASLARNKSYRIHQVSAPQMPEFKIAKRKIESSFDANISMHSIGNRNDFVGVDEISKVQESPRTLEFLSHAITEKRLPVLPFSSSQESDAVKELWSFSMGMTKHEHRESFMCIPELGKKDASTLSDILDATKRSLNKPASNDSFLGPLHSIPRVQTNKEYVSNNVMDMLVSGC